MFFAGAEMAPPNADKTGTSRVLRSGMLGFANMRLEWADLKETGVSLKKF